jgi:hypothetical protein
VSKPPYYRVSGDADGFAVFEPTESTVSVWAETMQHGSPPATLLVRAMEQLDPRPGARISRVVMEILGPIPLAENRVRAWVERPGAQVELLGAELLAPVPSGGYRAAARAYAWRLATADTPSAESAWDPVLPARSEGARWDPLQVYPPGYIDSLEWVRIEQPGPGQVWARPLVPLLDGEELSPLQRLFTVVDSANGIGAKLDIRKWTFLNTDLSVHIHREPQGEWVGLSAETSVGPDGIGMCAAVVYDERGPVARSAQTLLVRPR